MPLSQAVNVDALPEVIIDSSLIPDGVTVTSVVGENSREVTLDEFRQGTPIGMIVVGLAAELFRDLSYQQEGLEIGPTADDLRELTSAYLERRVRMVNGADPRDVWINFFRQKVMDHLRQAVSDLGQLAVDPVPMYGNPPILDTERFGERRWVRFGAEGKRSHLSRIACHTELEVQFANFLDNAADVERYVKNEWFDFIVPYHEHGVTKRYYPDYIIRTSMEGPEWILAETKGEIHPNTMLKRQAAEQWCHTLGRAGHGSWRYLFVPQRAFEEAMQAEVSSLAELCDRFDRKEAQRSLNLRQLQLVRTSKPDHEVIEVDRYVRFLPVYSLEAAAGYFGDGADVEREGWIEVDGRLNEEMFVARIVGSSMEPRIPNGSLGVFRRIPAGTRQGKIVLAQYRGPSDPDTGGSYTVKVYEAVRTFDEDGNVVRSEVRLKPLNPAFDSIIIDATDDEAIRIVAEFVEVLA